MIHIKGNSHFNINLKKYNNQIVISKSANNKFDFERLTKQINKQKEFFNIFLYSNKFVVPKIIISENYEFLMEYIDDSDSIISFLENANINKIKWLSNLLIEFIIKNIKLSKFENKLSLFIEKYENVKENSLKKYQDLKLLFKEIDNIFYNLNEINIPIGLCHGDLTLSNILICFDKQKIYFIDFLDNFIDTPFQDIVKLRQDTHFYWSVMLFDKPSDKNKIIINLQYMDNIIDTFFKKYDFYNQYNYFQILNLLRIIPYSKNNIMKNYLVNSIKQLI